MEEQSRQIVDIAREIMALSRNTVMVNLRFMDMAIGRLKLMADLSMSTAATDGEKLAYSPEYVIRLFTASRESTNRLYMHALLHCVFQHFYIGMSMEQQYWDLACDIAVEHIINELSLGCFSSPEALRQESEIHLLKNSVKYITAEVLYAYFKEGHISGSRLETLYKLFRKDSHDNWYKTETVVSVSYGQQSPNGSETSESTSDGAGENRETGTVSSVSSNPNESNSNGSATGVGKDFSDVSGRMKLAREWKGISEQMMTDLETFSKQRGDQAGSLMQNLLEVNREKYDYSDFLRKFAVMNEAMKVNDDEFDYIFYTYGLKLYGKMPLIEPLEYKEIKQVKEFVVAIDTSGSTSGELVQRFLQKTYNILKQEESFATRINVHIIQCDAQIQEDAKITTQEEFDNYLKTMKIRGLGGTDFRPVFSYVDELIKTHEFVNLKGMIYFTDGYGVFPYRQPEYSTAFVFLEDGYKTPQVPIWAMKIILRSDEI